MQGVRAVLLNGDFGVRSAALGVRCAVQGGGFGGVAQERVKQAWRTMRVSAVVRLGAVWFL